MDAMSSVKPEKQLQDVLDKFADEIGTLRRIGITDFALLTFVVRVREGYSREQAVHALLEGRTLTRKEKDLVRAALHRLVPE
jgi:hypothetical protein